MKRFCSLSLLILQFVFAFNLYAKPVKKQNNIKEPQYLSFDNKKLFEMDKSTDDFLELYNYLRQFKPSKPRGEFETKDEYETRLGEEKMEEEKNIKLYEFYVKDLPRLEYNNNDLFYTIKISSKIYRKNVSFTAILIYDKIEDLDSYLAANAGGKIVKVEKFNREMYYINIFDVDKHLSKNYLNDYVFTYKVDPQKAKDLKNNMSLIYEVIPYRPKDTSLGEYKYNNMNASTAYKYIHSDMDTFVFEHYSTHKPDTIMPIDSNVEEQDINTRAINIYLIDNRNNEILAKF